MTDPGTKLGLSALHRLFALRAAEPANRSDLTTTILMIRHATHDRLNRVLCGRMPGVSLNEAGERQARALAERLRQPITAIFRSPLERARETAEPLAQRLGLPIVVEERLTEIDFGAWTGLTFEALHQLPAWTQWNTERSRCRPPGGETVEEVQRRLTTWLAEMIAAYPRQAIVAVTHADVIKALVADILGSPIDRLHRFAVDPVSVSRIEADKEGARVIGLNEVPT